MKDVWLPEEALDAVRLLIAAPQWQSYSIVHLFPKSRGNSIDGAMFRMETPVTEGMVAVVRRPGGPTVLPGALLCHGRGLHRLGTVLLLPSGPPEAQNI